MDQFILDTVIPLLVTVISAFVLLVVRNTNQWIKTRATDEQYRFIEHVVSTAVNAAEQYLGSGEGEQKKRLVLTAATQVLQKRGINVDEDQLDLAIEAAVRKELAK
jgi:LL-H family phage holin